MSGLIERLRRGWQRRQLTDPQWCFLLDEPPPNEWVSLDCETTGLDTRHDEIVAIGAVRIVGQRILTSERLELLVRPEKGVSAESIRVHRLRQQDVEAGVPAEEAMRRLLRFIGPRPLVGYYLEFDVAMINRALKATLGNPKGSAWFPYTSPALFSMTIGFVGVWLFSILDRSSTAAAERAAFPAQQVRSETGLGAAKASAH